MSEEKRVLKGVLEFHSETGTEGGYWAFQDECYILKNVPRGYCKKCGVWMRKQSGNIQATRVDEIEIVEGRIRVIDRPVCADGSHEEDIGEVWSYDGLHVLETGDHLTIFDKDSPDTIVWDGAVDLCTYWPFTENAGGWWIHADQIGVDRDLWALWFFEEYPAYLIKK